MTVILNFPVFNPVSFGFTKDCESPTIDLNIGSHPWGHDVASGGEIALAYIPALGSAIRSSSTLT